MKVVIRGKEIADLVIAKPTDLDKHFLAIRRQTYYIPPQAFSKLRIMKKRANVWVEDHSDEVMVFPENCIHPYHSNGCSFDQDTVLAILWEEKCTEDTSLFGRFKSFISVGGGIGRAIWPFLGAIITIIIVAWAILSTGGIEF